MEDKAVLCLESPRKSGQSSVFFLLHLSQKRMGGQEVGGVCEDTRHLVSVCHYPCFAYP